MEEELTFEEAQKQIQANLLVIKNLLRECEALSDKHHIEFTFIPAGDIGKYRYWAGGYTEDWDSSGCTIDWESSSC